MRDYGVVSPKFWIGETGKSLRGKPESQIVALYLMTCPHANMIGVFHCPLVYIAHETGLSFEGASKALASLSEARFLTYDEASETVFVHRMAAYQVGESLKPEDNRVKSVAKEWQNIGPAGLKAAFAAIYSIAFHLPADDKKASPSKAPRKPLRSQEQDQDKNKTPSGPSPFEVFYQAYPKKEARKDAESVFAKLNPSEDLLARMLSAIEAKCRTADWTKDGGKFVPLPATWLRAERWNDEPVDTRTGDIWAGAL